MLNGHVFSVLGLSDVVRYGERLLDVGEFRTYLSTAIDDLERSIGLFLHPNYSLYDLKGQRADSSYSRLHAEQMKTLFAISGREVFSMYESRFARLAASSGRAVRSLSLKKVFARGISAAWWLTRRVR